MYVRKVSNNVKYFKGTCTLEEYEDVRLTALHGTNCEQFCQCAHAETEDDGSVTHYWVQHTCPSSTLFDEDNLVCNHQANVNCTGNIFFYLIMKFL